MITFQSKYYDSESGLYYYYHRYYDPKTGRFIIEDPIGISGGLKLYRFVNNNPVNYVDPWGLMPPSPGYYLSGYYGYWAKVRGAVKNKWDTGSALSCCIVNCMLGVNICCKGRGQTKNSPVVTYGVGTASTYFFEKIMVKNILTNKELIKSSLLKNILTKEVVKSAVGVSNWLGEAALAGQFIYCSIKCSFKR